MKIKETVTETKTYEKFVKRICDLCGTEGGHEWDGGFYEVNETEIKVTVKQRKGTIYPDGGGGTEYEVDLCPECFKNRLIPWLRNEGARVEKTEWDW